MGEGFVVLQSNRVDIYFYMDEPGQDSLLHFTDHKVVLFSSTLTHVVHNM